MENEERDNTLFSPPTIDTSVEEEEKTEKPEHIIVSPDQKDLKPSEYPVVNKQPYLTEILDIDKELYHTFDIKPQSEEIDDFIRSEIERKHLEDNKESYENLVKEYLKKINISEDTDIYSKLEQLYRYLKVQKKLLNGIKEREEILNSDPMELTAEKLKTYIELKGA